jgi:hypothetical protein
LPPVEDSSGSAVLIDHCGNDRAKGAQPNQIDERRKFVRGADRQEDKAFDHEQSERGRESEKQAVSGPFPKLEKEKGDRETSHRDRAGQEVLNHGYGWVSKINP